MEYIFGLRFSTYILERGKNRFVEMENGGKRQQKKKKIRIRIRGRDKGCFD